MFPCFEMYFCLQYTFWVRYILAYLCIMLDSTQFKHWTMPGQKNTPNYFVEDVLEPLKEGPVTHVHPCINTTWWTFVHSGLNSAPAVLLSFLSNKIEKVFDYYNKIYHLLLLNCTNLIYYFALKSELTF